MTSKRTAMQFIKASVGAVICTLLIPFIFSGPVLFFGPALMALLYCLNSNIDANNATFFNTVAVATLAQTLATYATYRV